VLAENTNFLLMQLVLKPFHIAVFSVEMTAPDIEGTFSAEIIFNTQFEVCFVPFYHCLSLPELVTGIILKVY
jgi:hypothetical protein